MSEPSSALLYHPPARLTVRELLAATGGRLVGASRDEGDGWTLCTDTRQLADGAVFVALRGEIHDGHRFVPAALAGGRRGALVDEAAVAEGLDVTAATGPVIVVPDTLVAFGDIGRAALLRQGPRVAAITGSVGKTTTRAMLASILRQRGPGLESQGNFNNRVGVPLTLLRLEPEHRWAVLEMGMSEPGEIRELARIAEPHVRVITEVVAAHLQYFDSIEQIADAKGELFEGAPPGSTLILPADNPLSDRFARPSGTHVVPFSMDPTSAAPARLVSLRERGLDGVDATLLLPLGTVSIRLALPGRHQVHNALAAAAAATAMGASLEEVVAGLAAVEVPGRRMKVRPVRGFTVLDDAYNANPASVAAALRTLAATPIHGGRRIAALGDMLELGPTGPELHADLGRLCAHLGLDLLVGAGPLMRHAVEAVADTSDPVGCTRAVAAEDAAEAGRFLTGWVREGDLLLIKGSRGMAMEGVLDVLSREEGS